MTPEKKSCIFCGSSESVNPIGGDKGICCICAEKFTDMLINTKRGKKESGNIAFGIRIVSEEAIEKHNSEKHK